jgi:hypothetical protein
MACYEVKFSFDSTLCLLMLEGTLSYQARIPFTPCKCKQLSLVAGDVQLNVINNSTVW